MTDELGETLPFDSIYPTLILPDNRPDSLSETLVPDDRYSGGVTTVGDLPRLDVVRGADRHAEYNIVDEIGRGGMGIVQLAEQNALGRSVAIKSVTQNHSDARDALLLEGRIMGLVEHPNVVPVHALGEDDDGNPLIVMKRIVGESWDVVMARPSDDPLERELRILLQVCQALGYAHKVGIIHRDIKPANVMVGEFGEVYLVDWGLALAVDDRYPKIPNVVGADAVVGTPAYIAPEMTIGQGDALGTFTDIYLVGAVLYEIVTGQPPHLGGNLFETLRSSYEGKPRVYSDETPDELRVMCETAMALEPSDRYADIRELQDAIEFFLQHRSSLALTQIAIDLIDEIESSIQRADDEESIYTLFNEVRFTLRNAVNVWGENQTAIDGLDRAIALMIEFELANDDPSSARKLSAELSNIDDELNQRIEEAVADHAERARKFEELAELEHDVDANIGSEKRAIPMFVLALGFLSIVAFPQIKALVGYSDMTIYVLSMLLMIIPLTLFTVTFRETFFSNFANRVLLKGFWGLWFLSCFLRFLVWMTETPFAFGLAVELLLYAAGAAQLMLAIDRRIAVATATFVLGAPFVAASATPWVAYGITGFIAGVLIGIAMRHTKTESFRSVSILDFLDPNRRFRDDLDS